ncbi:MAG: gluconokinase, partial [Solirubrobacteraceae bacterium]
MAASRIVIMGVSGSGKSAVGRSVAALTGLPFIDGDDLHPPQNIAKMAAGVPLDAGDREPWLRTVGETLAQAQGGMVMACSALARSYRDLIRGYAPDAVFVHLSGEPELIRSRLQERRGH